MVYHQFGFDRGTAPGRVESMRWRIHVYSREGRGPRPLWHLLTPAAVPWRHAVLCTRRVPTLRAVHPETWYCKGSAVTFMGPDLSQRGWVSAISQ